MEGRGGATKSSSTFFRAFGHRERGEPGSHGWAPGSLFQNSGGVLRSRTLEGIYGSRFCRTPSNDPAFLYQDILIAIAPERHINNGEPSLHALCLTALNITEGETIIHIGAGTGYYTAILAELTERLSSRI